MYCILCDILAYTDKMLYKLDIAIPLLQQQTVQYMCTKVATYIDDKISPINISTYSTSIVNTVKR